MRSAVPEYFPCRSEGSRRGAVSQSNGRSYVVSEGNQTGRSSRTSREGTLPVAGPAPFVTEISLQRQAYVAAMKAAESKVYDDTGIHHQTTPYVNAFTNRRHQSAQNLSTDGGSDISSQLAVSADRRDRTTVRNNQIPMEMNAIRPIVLGDRNHRTNPLSSATGVFHSLSRTDECKLLQKNRIQSDASHAHLHNFLADLQACENKLTDPSLILLPPGSATLNKQESFISKKAVRGSFQRDHPWKKDHKKMTEAASSNMTIDDKKNTTDSFNFDAINTTINNLNTSLRGNTTFYDSQEQMNDKNQSFHGAVRKLGSMDDSLSPTSVLDWIPPNATRSSSDTISEQNFSTSLVWASSSTPGDIDFGSKDRYKLHSNHKICPNSIDAPFDEDDVLTVPPTPNKNFQGNVQEDTNARRSKDTSAYIVNPLAETSFMETTVNMDKVTQSDVIVTKERFDTRTEMSRPNELAISREGSIGDDSEGTASSSSCKTRGILSTSSSRHRPRMKVTFSDQLIMMAPALQSALCEKDYCAHSESRHSLDMDSSKDALISLVSVEKSNAISGPEPSTQSNALDMPESDFLKVVASIVIQTFYRRHRAIHLALNRYKAILRIQAWIHRFLLKRKYDRLTLTRVQTNLPLEFHAFAATRIQAAFRGWLIRDSLGVCHSCASVIQRTYRSYLNQRYLKSHSSHDVPVMSLVKSEVESAKEGSLSSFNNAATKIQSLWRMYDTRMNFFICLANVLRIQSVCRRFLVRKCIFAQAKSLVKVTAAQCEVAKASVVNLQDDVSNEITLLIQQWKSRGKLVTV